MIEPLLLDPADRPKPESASPPPGFWIAGQRAAPNSDETFDSIDPTTGRSLATLAAAPGPTSTRRSAPQRKRSRVPTGRGSIRRAANGCCCRPRR